MLPIELVCDQKANIQITNNGWFMLEHACSWWHCLIDFQGNNY